jgi:hypothetical protein
MRLAHASSTDDPGHLHMTAQVNRIDPEVSVEAPPTLNTFPALEVLDQST